MKRLLFVFCATSVLVGCVSKSEYDAKVAENTTLKASLDEARRELDEIKFGPSRMYQQAKSQLEKGAFSDAIKTASILLEKHPASPEANQAKQLISLAKAGEEKAKLEAEAAKRAEEQRLANALHNMRKKHDDIKGVTWYHDKTSPRYNSERSNFGLYIGKEADSKPWLRLLIQYTSDDWLFIERYIVKADDKTFEIVPERFGGVERDNGRGGIWEWYDVAANEREIEIARAVANSKKAVIRYSGRQYHSDRVISATEKQAIKNVLAAYELLSRQ